MAYKLAKKPTFISRVTVLTPNQKGGFDTSTFMAEFNRVTVDETDELRDKPQREVMRQVLVGWTEFLDEDNEPVPFNDDTVLALLNTPEALVALRQSFWSSIGKAAEKN